MNQTMLPITPRRLAVGLDTASRPNGQSVKWANFTHWRAIGNVTTGIAKSSAQKSQPKAVQKPTKQTHKMFKKVFTYETLAQSE